MKSFITKYSEKNATQHVFTTYMVLKVKHQMTLNINKKIANQDTWFSNWLTSQKNQCENITQNMVNFIHMFQPDFLQEMHVYLNLRIIF